MLVEYDDLDWRRREWVNVYKEDLFHIFMVEQALMWAQRKDPFTKTHVTVFWPGLVSIKYFSTSFVYIIYLLSIIK